MRLLTGRAQELLEEERDVLRRLLDLLNDLGGEDEVTGPLASMIEHLDELFLVVIVGEFNAGKSTVVNALFRETIMEEGPVPTTAKITVIRHGDAPLTQPKTEYLEEKRLPSDLLRHLTLVDTPGTNSIVQQHQRITEDFIPRSDLVLFVTSFDRPLTESERQFLSYIREDWGRRLVVVLNKSDLADSEKDLKTVMEYLETNLEEILGVTPRIFPVSARTAFRSRREASASDAEGGEPRNGVPGSSGAFDDLEAFLKEDLAGPERVALKLTAPLETAERRLEHLADHLDSRREVLEVDEATLDELREMVEASRATLEESYARPLKRVDDRLMKLKGLGIQFLEDTIRASVSKIQLLRDRDRFKEAFRRQVIDDVERDVEDAVSDAVDGLLGRTSQLQGRLVETFVRHVREAGNEARPDLDRSYAYDRGEVVSATMREAERSLQTHDLGKESSRIVDDAHDAVNTFLGTGAGAGLGIVGGLILVLAPMLDVVGGLGLATGTALAVVGATILPRQRRKAIREFSDRVDELRDEVQSTLRATLDAEVDATLDAVWETVEPYAEFVDRERATIEHASTTRETLSDEVDALRSAIEDEFGTPSV